MARIGVSKKALHNAFDAIKESGFFSDGRFTRLFKDEVESWANLPAVPVSNCGMGLFAILRCLPKRSGIAVVATNTFFATGAMAKEAGYQVFGADCSKTDFCLTVETLERYAPGNTDVVILTHVGGGLASEYENIARWCAERDIFLVEDAAHALGVGGDVHGGHTAGSFGVAAAFSLYATKPMSVGEGGVVVTDYPGLADQLSRFVNYGKSDAPEGMRYDGVGFNARMSEWTAAIAYLQMQRRHEMMAIRAEAAHQLSRVVEPLVKWDQSTWYKFIVPAEFPTRRQTGKVYAASDQLTTSMGLPGVFPNAAWVAASHKCLPIEEGLYDGMSSGEISRYLGV
jgi:dTDP-4-amino-4,6-dideoxygalactose transaminase